MRPEKIEDSQVFLLAQKAESRGMMEKIILPKDYDYVGIYLNGQNVFLKCP